MHSLGRSDARRICVVSAILNATDVAAECRKFQAKMEQA
jgi:thiamine monophosphate synthase